MTPFVLIFHFHPSPGDGREVRRGIAAEVKMENGLANLIADEFIEFTTAQKLPRLPGYRSSPLSPESRFLTESFAIM